MTSFDPSHLPVHNHSSRGQAFYSRSRESRGLPLSIPDLRFEQSYLRSLRRFIHDTSPLSSSVEGHGISGDYVRNFRKPVEAAAVVSLPGVYGAPLQIEWGWVLWVTSRDQVISPLAQGVIWALASHFLRPFLGHVGAWVRIHVSQFWRSIFPPLEPHIHGGVGWMRDQFRGFTVGGVGTNIILAK